MDEDLRSDDVRWFRVEQTAPDAVVATVRTDPRLEREEKRALREIGVVAPPEAPISFRLLEGELQGFVVTVERFSLVSRRLRGAIEPLLDGDDVQWLDAVVHARGLPSVPYSQLRFTAHSPMLEASASRRDSVGLVTWPVLDAHAAKGRSAFRWSGMIGLWAVSEPVWDAVQATGIGFSELRSNR